MGNRGSGDGTSHSGGSEWKVGILYSGNRGSGYGTTYSGGSE